MKTEMNLFGCASLYHSPRSKAHICRSPSSYSLALHRRHHRHEFQLTKLRSTNLNVKLRNEEPQLMTKRLKIEVNFESTNNHQGTSHQ